MKKELIKIGIGILLFTAGWKILDYAGTIVSKEAIQKLQEFCDKSTITKGKIEDSYKEITVKIGKIKTKMYEYTYDFEVNGSSYFSTYTSNVNSVKDSIEIWYNKENPSENSTSNPCADLERTKRGKTIGNSTFYYVVGFLLLLIGFGLAWSSIKQLIRNLFGSKKK